MALCEWILWVLGSENKCIFYGHNNLSVAHFLGQTSCRVHLRLALKLSQEYCLPRTAQPFPNSAKGNSTCSQAEGPAAGRLLWSHWTTALLHILTIISRIHLISATSSLPHPALPFDLPLPHMPHSTTTKRLLYSRLQDDQTSQF